MQQHLLLPYSDPAWQIDIHGKEEKKAGNRAVGFFAGWIENVADVAPIRIRLELSLIHI